MDYYAIGQRIRKARKAKQLSQEQLAERVGISTTHMSHIETGNTKLSIEVFAQITQALDSRADELLFGAREISTEQVAGEIEQLMRDCNPTEQYIIADTVKAVKEALKKHSM